MTYCFIARAGKGPLICLCGVCDELCCLLKITKSRCSYMQASDLLHPPPHPPSPTIDPWTYYTAVNLKPDGRKSTPTLFSQSVPSGQLL